MRQRPCIIRARIAAAVRLEGSECNPVEEYVEEKRQATQWNFATDIQGASGTEAGTKNQDNQHIQQKHEVVEGGMEGPTCLKQETEA